MTKKLAVAVAAMAVSLLAGAASDDPRFAPNSPPGADSKLPFNEAVWAGDTLYLSGHIGSDLRTEKTPQDPALEAKLVLDAVKATAERAGLSMDDLVTVTVYCTDLNLYDTFNRVYKGYFHSKYPARAFVGVAQLLRGAHFEVQGTAVRGHRASNR